MPSVTQTINAAPLTSLQTSLTSGNIEELHRFIEADSHLDISSFWTRANQANDSANATSACKAISALLVKIDGERGFTSPGSAFIRRVLLEHSKSIFRNLSSSRPMYVNPTLRMLITMSQFDAGALANDVYLAMDFGTFQALPKLLKASNPQARKPTDEKVVLGKRKREDGTTKSDTRGLFLGLLFTLLNHVPSSSKAEILQRRPIMTELIKNLGSDPEDSIQKTLKGFATILESRDFPRPAKVQFFNEWTLSQLLPLYNRSEVAENTGKSVRQVLQDFLMRITTVPDQGICFVANGLAPPSNKKLYNPILSSFLSSLRPLADDMQYDLMLAIMGATPELIAPWLQSTSLDFSPRLGVDWIQAMGLLESILAIPLPETTNVTLSTIPDYVLLENVMPSVLSKIITKAIQHESELVRLMTCRTLLKALRKLSTLSRGPEKCYDIVEAVQRRVPLLEILLPTANAKLYHDSPEESILLRETVIGILRAYVESFEEVPSFDFVTLFNSIMTATLLTSSGESEKVDTGTEPETSPVASALEKEMVLSMTNKVEGLQWLSKKKGTMSVFRVILQHICGLGIDSPEARYRAIEVLDNLVTNDSFMFCTELGPKHTRRTAPVPKIEAVIRALDECKNADHIEDISEFIEDSMIRFQASPYKYWDSLTSMIADDQRHDIPEFSPILLTFHEQLGFVTDKPHIRKWLDTVMTLLIGIGEDQRLGSRLVDRQLPQSLRPGRSCLWSAITSLLSLERAAVSGSDTTLFWLEIRQELKSLAPTDAKIAKAYALSSWSNIGHPSSVTFSEEAISTMISYWTRKDFEEDSGSETALTSLLSLYTSTKAPSLGNIVSSGTAQRTIDALTAPNLSINPHVIAALIDCLDTKGSLRDDHIKRLQHRINIWEAPVLPAITRAVYRSVLESSSLLQNSYPAPRSSESEDWSEGPDWVIAELIVAISSMDRNSLISEHCISWVKRANLSAASLVIAAQLESPNVENNKLAEQLLIDRKYPVGDHHLHSIELENAVSKCLVTKAKLDPEFGALILDEVVVRLSASKGSLGTPKADNFAPISTIDISILTSLRLQDNGRSSGKYDQIFTTMHRDIAHYLTVRFAHDTLDKSETPSENLLEFLRAMTRYIDTHPGFIDDVGNALMNPMVSAALEHQSRRPQVLQFLMTIVHKSHREAFSYTRAVQEILADPTAFDTTEIRLLMARLLRALILHDPSKSSLSVLDMLIKLYMGTVNPVDLCLFETIGKLECALGISTGTRFRSWRLVESMNDVDQDRSATEAVLSSDLALSTILHFAEHDEMSLETQPSGEFKNVYDLRFVIALIAGFIHSDSSMTMIKQLIEHHALGLALLGLASKYTEIRQASAMLINKFYRMILSSTIREKSQLEVLLAILKDSITSTDIETRPIARVQAVFFALAGHLLLNPSHYLYEKVNRFLLARPQLDLSDIPLFLNLFYSSENYGKEIGWLLKVLTAGISDTSEKDYKRRHVLELFMGLFRSKSASPRLKDAIGQFLERSVGVEGMRLYFERIAGPVWLSMGNEPELACVRTMIS